MQWIHNQGFKISNQIEHTYNLGAYLIIENKLNVSTNIRNYERNIAQVFPGI